MLWGAQGDCTGAASRFGVSGDAFAGAAGAVCCLLARGAVGSRDLFLKLLQLELGAGRWRLGCFAGVSASIACLVCLCCAAAGAGDRVECAWADSACKLLSSALSKSCKTNKKCYMSATKRAMPASMLHEDGLITHRLLLELGSLLCLAMSFACFGWSSESGGWRSGGAGVLLALLWELRC